MIESPLIQELMAQTRHDDILHVLEKRFGTLPPELTLAVRSVQDEKRLRDLLGEAALCPDLATFQTRLLA